MRCPVFLNVLSGNPTNYTRPCCASCPLRLAHYPSPRTGTSHFTTSHLAPGTLPPPGNYNYKDQPTRQNGPAIKHIFRYRLCAFAPSCIGKYQERKFQGANVPQLELSLPGANGLGNKKSIYKDTDLVLYSLTTVRAFSFQSSVINSDILSSIHKTTRTTIARRRQTQHDVNLSEKIQSVKRKYVSKTER